MAEFTSEVGRLVGGHPMIASPKADKHGTPLMRKDAPTEQRMQTYIGLAIPKHGEADWKQTGWGQLVVSQALAGYVNRETDRPDFSWKVVDGDSPIPNKKGIPPNTREGYPGHWILNLSTELPVRCFHKGKYDPMQQIQNKAEIKPGDYVRVMVDVKANGSSAKPAESPGVFMNPMLVELFQPGQEIILSGGPSAAEAFGGSAGQLPPGAQVAAGGQTAPPPPGAAGGVQPAPDFLNPPPPAGAVAAPPPPPVVERFNYNGQIYTRDQLVGWTEAQINALPRA